MRKGSTQPEGIKRRISETMKSRGIMPPVWTRGHMKGKHFSEEHKMKIGEAQRGVPRLYAQKEGHWNWQGGISSLRSKLHNSLIATKWNRDVKKRDNYTCQECGIRGGDLESHHIITVSYFLNILRDIYGKEKVFEKSLKHKLLWSLRNGITLCLPCHRKTMGKEESFEKQYFQITYQV